MAVLRRPWAYATVYTCLSLTIEGGLIVLAGLSVPEDNGILAPVVLTVPPAIAALAGGNRRADKFALLTILTIVLTLAVTLVANKATGVSTGLLEPIVDRWIAGFLAAMLTFRLTARGEAASEEGRGGARR